MNFDGITTHLDIPAKNEAEAWLQCQESFQKAVYNRTDLEHSRICTLLNRLFFERHGVPFTVPELIAMCKVMRWLDLEAHEVLFEKYVEDDLPDNVYIVVHGCLRRVYTSVNGRVSQDVIRGAIVGAPFEVKALPVTAKYETSEFSRCLAIPQASYEALLGKVIDGRRLQQRMHFFRQLTVPILAAWSEDEIEQLARAVFPQSYLSRAISVREGEQSDALYFLVHGKLRVVREIEFTAVAKGEPCAKLLEVATLTPGEYYGELGLLRANIDAEKKTRFRLAKLDAGQSLIGDSDDDDSDREDVTDATPDDSLAGTTRSALMTSMQTSVASLSSSIALGASEPLRRRATIFAHTPAEVFVLTRDRFHALFRQGGSALARMREYAKGYPSAQEVRGQFLKQQKWSQFKSDMLSNRGGVEATAAAVSTRHTSRVPSTAH